MLFRSHGEVLKPSRPFVKPLETGKCPYPQMSLFRRDYRIYIQRSLIRLSVGAVDDAACCLVQYVYASGMCSEIYESGLRVDMDGFYVIGFDTLIMRILLETVIYESSGGRIVMVETSAFGPDPERVVRILCDTTDDVVIERIPMYASLDVPETFLERVPVIDASIPGAKPHAALIVSCDASHRRLGQAPGSERVAFDVEDIPVFYDVQTIEGSHP